MQNLVFTSKVKGIHVAQLNTQRELVVRKAGRWGYRVSIRDIGSHGFGTDLRLSAAKLGEAQAAAGRFAAQLVTL